MEIFDIGTPELILIFLLALILMGPKKLGEAGATIGKWLNSFFKSDTWMVLREISNAVVHLPTRLAREANLEELERELQLNPDLKNDNHARRHSPKAGEAVDHSILPPERSQPAILHTPAQPPSVKKPAAKPASKKSSPTTAKKTKPAAKPKVKGKKRADA